MDTAQYYPHLSQWTIELGPVPNHDELVQAFALALPEHMDDR